MQWNEGNLDTEFVLHKPKKKSSHKILFITLLMASLVILGIIYPNLLPFSLSIPFLIIFYYLKLYATGTYKLQTLRPRNDVLLVSDKRKKRYLAFTILQVRNLPANIVVKEERIRRGKIEKLIIPSNTQYLYEHLTFLSKIVPSLIFEVRVVKNDIRLRILLTTESDNLDVAINRIQSLKKIVETTFMITFPGLTFERPTGYPLQRVWGEIFTEYSGQYGYKLERDRIVIDRAVDKIHMAILKFTSPPTFNISGKKIQLDQFIKRLMGGKFDLNYIISMEPEQTLEFMGQSSLVLGDKKFEISEEGIRQSLQEIRLNEKSAIWKVSGYVVIRSLDGSKLNSDLEKLKNVLPTVFGVECEVITRRRLKGVFSRIPMRCMLQNPVKLMSEKVSILFHFPEEEISTVSRSDIPEFEIPPERNISNGTRVGRVLLDKKEMYPLHFSIEDIRLHIFITGEPGTGKTRFVINFLKNFMSQNPEINFLCIDWKAKFTYLVDKFPTRVMEYAPESNYAPFSINLFDPQGMNADEYARKLTKILEDISPDIFRVSQLKEICLEAIKQIVKHVKSRSIDQFIIELRDLASSSLKSKVSFAVITDLINFFENLRNTVLDAEKSRIDFSQLLRQKSILNFALLKENQIVSKLLLNIIVIHIFNQVPRLGISDSLKYLIVLEDAHLIAPSILRDTPEVGYVDIPLLLRSAGIALIASTPNPTILPNFGNSFGTFVIFRTTPSPNICRVLNLNEIQEKYLSKLPSREAIVSLSNFQQPFRIFTDYIDIQKSIPVLEWNTPPSTTLPQLEEGKKPGITFNKKGVSVYSAQESIEEIRTKLAESFMRKGLIAKIHSNYFDYVCYERKCLIKIYQRNERDEGTGFQEKITSWCEKAHQLGYPELILIVPSDFWHIKFETLIPAADQCHIFSTSDTDWNKLTLFLKKKDIENSFPYKTSKFHS